MERLLSPEKTSVPGSGFLGRYCRMASGENKKAGRKLSDGA